ncbi:hypothetical protein PMAYCL1PPCAC_03697, partial [Pristionchus mayeri]
SEHSNEATRGKEAEGGSQEGSSRRPKIGGPPSARDGAQPKETKKRPSEEEMVKDKEGAEREKKEKAAEKDKESEREKTDKEGEKKKSEEKAATVKEMGESVKMSE